MFLWLSLLNDICIVSMHPQTPEILDALRSGKTVREILARYTVVKSTVYRIAKMNGIKPTPSDGRHRNMKRLLNDPVFQKKFRAGASRSLKERHRDPEFRAKMQRVRSESALRRWSDPSYRKHVSAAIAAGKKRQWAALRATNNARG